MSESRSAGEVYKDPHLVTRSGTPHSMAVSIVLEARVVKSEDPEDTITINSARSGRSLLTFVSLCEGWEYKVHRAQRREKRLRVLIKAVSTRG